MPLSPRQVGKTKEQCACFQNEGKIATGQGSGSIQTPEQRTGLASVLQYETKINVSTHVTYFIMYFHFALQKKLIQIQYMFTFQT